MTRSRFVARILEDQLVISVETSRPHQQPLTQGSESIFMNGWLMFTRAPWLITVITGQTRWAPTLLWHKFVELWRIPEAIYGGVRTYDLQTVAARMRFAQETERQQQQDWQQCWWHGGASCSRCLLRQAGANIDTAFFYCTWLSFLKMEVV